MSDQKNVTNKDINDAVAQVKAATDPEEVKKASIALGNLAIKVIGQQMRLQLKVEEMSETLEGMKGKLGMMNSSLESTAKVASEARGEQMRRTIAQDKAIAARKSGKISMRQTAKDIKKITEHLGYDIIETRHDENNRIILGIWCWSLSTGQTASIRRKVQEQSEKFRDVMNGLWPKDKDGKTIHIERALVLHIVAQVITKLRMPLLDAEQGTPTTQDTLPLQEEALEEHPLIDEGTVIVEGGEFTKEELQNISEAIKTSES